MFIFLNSLNARSTIRHYCEETGVKSKRPMGVVIFCLSGLILIGLNLLPRIVPLSISKMIFLILWLTMYYSLFNLKNWARLALCIIQSLSAVLLIICLFSSILFKPSIVFMYKLTFRYGLNYAFSLIDSLAFVYYFTRPRVKGHFLEKHGEPEYHQGHLHVQD